MSLCRTATKASRSTTTSRSGVKIPIAIKRWFDDDSACSLVQPIPLFSLATGYAGTSFSPPTPLNVGKARHRRPRTASQSHSPFWKSRVAGSRLGGLCLAGAQRLSSPSMLYEVSLAVNARAPHTDTLLSRAMCWWNVES